ncbi:P-type ATPase [Aspergillus sclerotialis]|uniref:P-type ATPase n=1 Tax=Aspergillus sclerotialis TaxID=2070753 RepID=A0A3A2ZTM5_9EURO|nr:P-type ATPase [Aspergillus sclerotialis]
MAHDEVFDGPISESIPSSTVSFAHRRDRRDSTVSFTYFQEEDDFAEYPDEDAVDIESEIEGPFADDLNYRQDQNYHLIPETPLMNHFCLGVPLRAPTPEVRGRTADLTRRRTLHRRT